MTYLEEIRFIFDQVRPVDSHLEVRLPDKHLTPNKIYEALKGPQRQLWRESLFVQYDKKKCQPSFVSHTNQISP